MPTTQDNPASFDAHDLLWLADDTLERQHQWASQLPDWALSELQQHNPVVVRRAPPQHGLIPVGIRGRQRSQRFGTYIPVAEVARRLPPPSQQQQPARPHRAALPSLQAWNSFRDKASAIPYVWGPTGSCAYELATQADWVSQSSDLDLVVYIDTPISRRQATALLDSFHTAICRTDVQIMTPQGGMALIEWARGDEQVLLKTPYGPVLTKQPWGVQEHL